ncbi:glycoside hydrolase family 64 protein [Didymella exigua CBS 183.55]|uniref:Glycoside hydrolase family 64 protein n=1 Tax=Didymella exigua CBS 183.55 TaxID=1150837 RepID=A0A6A5RFF1_9PLEO|nr:glycoside hydrolase family 64 protein [Didymella exigua CBS 183.55]KAF1926179.1 glycoside hydrolase family 64 protein [Didymella exigua CBS 183.55]
MPDSLQVALKNDSDSENIHAYVVSIAIKHDGKRCLLKANGKDLYFPTEVKDIGSSLQEDCAIPLGAPGNTTNITIPQIAGGRIWIVDGKLTFLLNPGGPALVEPSVLNPSDPNHGVSFGFAEFTLNDAQLYANISYVDFVPKIPIAISLQQHSGEEQRVAGMRPDGLDRMADSLREQAQKDGRPWDKLVVNENGQNLRILNATHGGAVGADFSGYFEPLVDQAWDKYANCKCRVNTQAGPGVLEGHITSAGKLKIGDEEFEKPNTADILGCNSGPFTTGQSPARNAIIPRLAAAFVRSSITETQDHPSQPHTFYNRDPTNHYARLVHEHNVDNKGYAFAYDDVQPDSGDDQSGKVNAGDPKLFIVSVGGKSAGQGAPAPAPAPPQHEQQQQQPQQSANPPPPPPAGAAPAEKKGFGDRLFDRAKGKAKGFLQR